MRVCLALSLLGLGLVWLVGQNGPAQAQTQVQTQPSPANCRGTVQSSRQIVIDCAPGYVTGHDLITLVSHNKGFKPGQDWQAQLDYADSTWLFDTGTRGRASLIIDFHRDGSALVAELYDDGNDDGFVEYQNDPNAGPVRILENLGHWTLRVTAKDGWWTRDGLTNFNLDILVDGPVRGNFNSGFTYDYKKLLKTDGLVDYEIHVRDPNHNGRPDYEWRQDRSPLPEDPHQSGQYRTEIDANPRDNEVPLSGSFFWPYLNYQQSGYNKPYSQSPAPIQLDWAKAKISQVAEFVASRGSPNNYFIYSLFRVKEGEISPVNFESPFAFYDLAQANDGWPDTIIRVENSLPQEILGTGVTNPGTTNIVEYAWGREHNHSLNYQVSLAGRKPLTDTIQFPEFGVHTVPYDKLPYWTADQPWDAATFVEVEKQPYWTSEAVYEYNVELGEKNGLAKVLPWGYIQGRDNQPPTKAFQQAAVGQRGEYLFYLNDKPYLYFSPVDHKLHLLKAEGGIWNMDGTAQIQYSKLGQGDFINQWTYSRPVTPTGQSSLITPTRQLNIAPDYLLYSDDTSQEVVLRQATVKPDLFRALPPRTPDEWKSLGAQIGQNQASFDPTDFKAMLGQFPGPQIAIQGATLHDYRQLDDGFRFALDLRDGFTVKADPAAPLDLEGLEPGSYIVNYDGSQFHIDPLLVTTPQVHLTNLGLLNTAQPAQAFLPQEISVEVENYGLEDTGPVPVEIRLQSPAGASRVLTGSLASLPAQQKLRVNLPWTPEEAGRWQIQAQLTGQALPPVQVEIGVGASPQSDWQWNFQASGADLPGLGLLLGLALVVGGGFGVVFVRQLLAPEERERHEE